MTDKTIPDVTDEERILARKWAEFIESDMTALSNLRTRAAARVLLAVLPKRPTLADMTDTERTACRWMQCDYGEPGRSQSRGVIGYFDYGEKKAIILTTVCGIVRRDYDRVTPRPDLPRMEWPAGDQGAGQ